MKEFCGYKASDNSLWETKKECEEQEIKLRIQSLLSKISILESQIKDFINREFRKQSFINRGDVTRHQSKEIVKGCLVFILTDGKQFLLSLYEKGNEYKKELDELESKLEDINKPWYLKMKWWN